MQPLERSPSDDKMFTKADRFKQEAVNKYRSDV